MKANEVSIDDGMVVDYDGSVWVYKDERWHYLTDAGLSSTEAVYELPAYLEPYTKLAANPQSLIRMTLLRTHYCLVG